MYALTELSHQHDVAISMAERLLDLVNEYRSAADALPIALQLNRLVGLLRVHLAQEDVQLYPELIASGRMALAYASEMGGLAGELELFAQRWSSSVGIAAAFAEFAEVTRELMLRLATRIERENRYLYPLAGPPVRRAA
jgi:hypothetical protein